MEILTLPMREGILYLPCPSGIGIEILTLSVRVSIGMFSAHIKEYGLTFYLTQNISTENLTWSLKVDEKSTYN